MDTRQPDLVRNIQALIQVATHLLRHLPQAAQDLNTEAKDGEELILKNPVILRLHLLQVQLREEEHTPEDLQEEVTAHLPEDLLAEATAPILEDPCSKQTMEMMSLLTLKAILVPLTVPWELDMVAQLLTEDLVDIHK